MLENFHATIKIITGEEVLAQVMPASENDKSFFILSNPIVVHENMTIDQEKGIAVSGLIPKRWMVFGNDDLTIVNREHVISMSELDQFGVDFYEKALVAARVASPIKKKVEAENTSGFIGRLDSFRKQLESYWEDPESPGTSS